MSFRYRTALYGLPFTLIACAAFAQPTMDSSMGSFAKGTISSGQSASAIDPPAATRSALVPRYRSALEGYRPFVDEAVTATSWRESNDRVGQIGGWRAYAAEIQGESAGTTSPGPAAGTDSATPSGSADGHEGHHTR